MKHLPCIIHCSDTVSRLCQDHGEKARACANVQYLDFLLGHLGKFCLQHIQPGFFLHSLQLLVINFGIPLRAGTPVFFYFFQQHFHSSVLYILSRISKGFGAEQDSPPAPEPFDILTTLLYQNKKNATSPMGGLWHFNIRIFVKFQRWLPLRTAHS